MEQTADEIRRLQGCINDLISVLAIPALWRGQESAQIVSTLLDVLVGMLRLDFAYARLKDPVGGAPIEMVRLALSRNLTARPQEIGQVLNGWLGDDPQKWPLLVRNPVGDGDVSIVPLRLGLRDEIGVIVAGSQRADFPTQTERLLLNVAANQAAIGLQEARLLGEQKRVAEELDQRVAQRAGQLLAANEELEKEIAERRRGEVLFAGEKRLLEMIATGVPLEEILNELCLIIEEYRSGTLASVLLLRPDGLHLDSVAGPSLPKGWTQQMEKLPIGPCAGSCGTAAYRGSRVIVSDIATDPLWEVPEHRAAALKHGLRASWSNPVLSSEGKVLGTFCIYNRETRSPSQHDLGLIEKATDLARVAIERDRAEAALRTSEEKYRDLINASPDAICVLDADSKCVLVNPAGLELAGRPEEELIGFSITDTYVPEELHLFRDRIDKLKAEGSFRFKRKFLRKNGEVIPVEISLSALRGQHYQAIIRDISQRKRREALLAGENRVLEMVAKGDSLSDILDNLCLLVEGQSSGVLASILLMDPNGKQLRHGAAPNLPEAYTEAIDGAFIGPAVGSCGTAAYRAEQVIVSDIAADPLWADFRELALAHSLRACWSTPI